LTVNLTQGQTASVTLTSTPQSMFYYWRIWIDYNRDGDFNDAGEKVFENYILSNATLTGSFTVPSSGVVTGQKVGMRVSLGNYYREVCATSIYSGEVEDYAVIIQ
jgi:hypothetical protein